MTHTEGKEPKKPTQEQEIDTLTYTFRHSFVMLKWKPQYICRGPSAHTMRVHMSSDFIVS